MSGKKYEIYGIGNALVDTEIEVHDQLIKDLKINKGQMSLIDETRLLSLKSGLEGIHHKKACGGSAANTLIAHAQFGGKAYYSCKVAQDELGSFYLNDLKHNGVDAKLKTSSNDGQTGQCLVLVTPDSERTMETYLGISSKFSATDLHEEALLQSEYLYLEGYLVAQEGGRNAMMAAKEMANKAGVKVALTLSDPSMVQYFGTFLNQVIGTGLDLVFSNEAEALKYTNTDNVFAAKEVMKKAAKKFVITLGSRGAIVYDGKSFHDIPAFKVKAVDANGTGDMFAGAFLYGITHNLDFPTAGRLASYAASRVVAQFGPRLKKEQVATLAKEILG